MSLTYHRPWLYPKQRRAIFAPYRIVAVEASTKSGKTAGCMAWLFEQAVVKGRPGRNFWWVAPVYGQAKIAFRRFKVAIPKTLYTANNSELTITLANGATLWFKSGEKPDALYGEDVWAVVLDEAPRMRAEAFHAVRSTLTATRGALRAIGHPKGRGTWHFKLGQRARELMAEAPTQREIGYFRLTWRDAVAGGIFPASEVEEARRLLPEEVFRELYEAEASETEGNPFGHAHLVACQLGAEDEIGEAVAWGWDLAKAEDWTFGIGLDANGSLAQLRRWQGVPWGETVQRIVAATNGKPAWVDATGVGDPVFEALQAASPAQNFTPFVFTGPSKQQLMERLAVAVQRHEPGLPDPREHERVAAGAPERWDAEARGIGAVLFEELDSFEYQYVNRTVRYGAPEGMHDDGVMALGLAWAAFAQSAALRELGAPVGLPQASIVAGLAMPGAGVARDEPWTPESIP